MYTGLSDMTPQAVPNWNTRLSKPGDRYQLAYSTSRDVAESDLGAFAQLLDLRPGIGVVEWPQIISTRVVAVAVWINTAGTLGTQLGPALTTDMTFTLQNVTLLREGGGPDDFLWGWVDRGWEALTQTGDSGAIAAGHATSDLAQKLTTEIKVNLIPIALTLAAAYLTVQWVRGRAQRPRS